MNQLNLSRFQQGERFLLSKTRAQNVCFVQILDKPHSCYHLVKNWKQKCEVTQGYVGAVKVCSSHGVIVWSNECWVTQKDK